MTITRNALKKIALAAFAVLMIAILVFVNIPGACAEENTDCSLVTLHVKLRHNRACATYGVFIYVDGTRLCYLDQGDMATYDLLMPRGSHRIAFVPERDWAQSCSWELNLMQEQYTVETEIQTHSFYVDMNGHSVKADDRVLTEKQRESIANWKVGLKADVGFIDLTAEMNGTF